MNKNTYGRPVMILRVRKKRARYFVQPTYSTAAEEYHTEHNGDDGVTTDGVEENGFDCCIAGDFFVEITRVQCDKSRPNRLGQMLSRVDQR